MQATLQNSFMQLVRLGIGTSKDAEISNDIDWEVLKALAEKQGLAAVILDALNTDDTNFTDTMPIELKLEWIGEVWQGYELRYRQYEKSISSLAGWYNQHGFKMMVLKGYACSLDWPKPEHRPCGDIDTWLFGEQKAADAALTREKGIKIDNSHHHHTVFDWKGFMVENHYDFINIHHHKSHVALEKVLKKLGADDSYSIEISGEKVYLPSPNLHALFLLKHAALHFVGTELTFRQVLDWAFFVQKQGEKIDWNHLLEVINEHGMMPFFHILNSICVEELGFDPSLFPKIIYNPMQKDRLLEEVFSYVYHDDKTSNFFVRQANRFRRWKENSWKHELCYKESMGSAFWSAVWGHILKPSSF